MKNLFKSENVKKVLVTGANGFIGSNLVDCLAARDVYVKCLVYHKDQLQWINNLPGKVEIIVGDIVDINSLKDAVQGVDVIFHLAGVVKSLQKRDFFNINVQGTENLLKATVKYNPNLQRFLFMSSQSASGPSCNGDVVTENNSCCPVSEYGRSKLEAENVVLSYSNIIPVTILRPSAVYGPRDREFLFIFDLIKKGIRPFMGFHQRFLNFCYIDDLIKATILASINKQSIGQTYFIHSDEKFSLNQFIEEIVHSLNKRVIKLPVPFFLIKLYFLYNEFFALLCTDRKVFTRDKYNELKQNNWGCSIDKAKKEIGYIPDYCLTRGISKSIQWYKKQGWL